MARTKQTARKETTHPRAPSNKSPPMSLKRKIDQVDKEEKSEEPPAKVPKFETVSVVQVFVMYSDQEPGLLIRYMIPEDEFEDCKELVTKANSDQLTKYNEKEVLEMIDQWENAYYQMPIKNGPLSSYKIVGEYSLPVDL